MARSPDDQRSWQLGRTDSLPIMNHRPLAAPDRRPSLLGPVESLVLGLLVEADTTARSGGSDQADGIEELLLEFRAVRQCSQHERPAAKPCATK